MSFLSSFAAREWVRTKPKKFGTDTRAVLQEAGYSAAEIDALVASGIALTEIKK